MKTVKVRVAVVVNEKGQWNAEGYFDWPDGRATGAATSRLLGTTKWIHFITAELPVPEVQEVAAKVEKSL